jgi:hypothetical protein
MALSNTKHLGQLSWVSLFALGAAAHAQDSEWVRHFRIGVSSGMNIKTDFRSAGTFPISGNNPGAAVGGINHEYDNGYVRLDATGDAAPPGQPSQTTNFSYTDAGQYDPAANTLTYQATRSFALSAPASKQIDDLPDLGFDLAYGSTIRVWQHASIGWEFGFNMNFLAPKDRTSLTGDATITRHQYTSTSPSGSFPPANQPGNPSGAGSATINDTPTDLGDITTSGTITGSRGLDATLYNLRLGPLFRWEFYPRWTVNASAGVAFTIIDAEYTFDETLTLTGGATSRNRGHFGTTDFSLGGYAGAVLMYDTGNNWEPYLGAHFYSMQDSKVAKAGRSANIDLGAAIYISAGINWTF